MAFRTTFSALATIIAFGLPLSASADGHINADTVVATVNGKDLTLGHMIVLKQRLPQQYLELPGDVLFDGILDQLVQQTLFGEQVDELSLGTQLTLENEERALRANEEIKRIAEGALTDDALQAAYAESYGAAEPETEYNASHILVRTEEEAMALIEELNGGADFAELAKEKSEGPSGPRGGELGWFGTGAMVPAFEEAVIALEVEAISEPVQTQFGWHVIRLNETRLTNAPALEEVRGELADGIQRQAIETEIQALEDAADVTRVTAGEIDPALLDDLSLLGD
jgi:peptidyl-prolyl cis-trans isomerase C